MSVEPPATAGYVQESNLKLLQLEHDLKLKEMKLQLNELSSKTQIEELRNECQKLEISVSKLAKEKVDLLRSKDDQIMKARLELKHLEQDLINAKLESACLKSRLDQQ